MSPEEAKELRRIAREFDMDAETQREFGKYLEECKKAGDRGQKNDRGDFTIDELRDKAKEFLDSE